MLVGFCHKEHMRASRATKENEERLLLLSACTFPSKTWRSVFVFRRAAQPLSRPALRGLSWTARRAVSCPRAAPDPLPSGGLRPRPRKPTAPRAAGHERALRATRNPSRLPSRHESAPPHPRPSRIPQRLFSPGSFCHVHELTRISRIWTEFVSICEDSWTTAGVLSNQIMVDYPTVLPA